MQRSKRVINGGMLEISGLRDLTGYSLYRQKLFLFALIKKLTIFLSLNHVDD
ncbi:hypothetical protein AB1303_02245 [Saccharolobus solfataricus]|uniref:hypothetical protein n=1 Tax=Saccharolobus solfataricus TaxID=2287 RepID=UPI0012FEFACF|nr:hypothetical protein [Saccharolobus solfataricus]